MKIPFSAALVLRIAALVLVVVAVAGLYTSWRVGQSAAALSDRVVRQTSTLVSGRVGTLLDRTESQARIVAGLTRPTFAENLGVATDASSFPLLAAQLVEILRANPEFAAVTVTLERTGEYVQAAQTSASAVQIQTSELNPQGSRVRRELVPFGDRLVQRGQPTAWAYDPRTEAAYTQAKNLKRLTWTETKILTNLPVGPTPGVTCAAPVISADGRFLGVATITLTLTDLSRFLKTVTVSPNGFVSVFEFTEGNQLRVIADPQPQRILVNTAEGQRLAETNDITDPVLRGLAQEVQGIPRFQPTETQFARFRVDQESFLLGVRRIFAPNRPAWVVTVVVPQNDFLDWSRETAVFFLTFTLVALASGVGAGLLLAKRVAKPLTELAAETARIKTLDLQERDRDPTGIAEIDTLAESIETLKAGLRSMEKLVPADYARWLISSGQEAKLGGERRHITTYFGDIVGFTRLSHQLPPEELVTVLAEYLDVLSKEVLDHGGTLDKFNGDDVMAFWGAPTLTTDHAAQALRSALRSIASLEKLHAEWRELGRPVLTASFGIATGDVIVGNVGSRQRMNYTVIGDSVNLASRLQSLNKSYGTHVLASRATIDEAITPEGQPVTVWRSVDIVEVVNREEPVEICEPLALAEDASPATQHIAQTHNKAFQAYKKQQFAKAARLYEEVLQISPADGPAKILHTRSLHYLQSPPPPQWNGAHTLTIK